jgi:hypothetical protein
MFHIQLHQPHRPGPKLAVTQCHMQKSKVNNP